MGKLANLYGAQGIPHLVVLDKDGTVIIPDGVGKVAIDPNGERFPWRPQRFVDLLPEQYLRPTDGRLAATSDLDDKYLLVYASAHWCPPCQAFTPKLAQAYQALKKQRDDFEILFLSSDHDQQTFDSYFAEMPFGAIPYEERTAKAEIAEKLHISRIPSLLVFGPKPRAGDHGETVSGDGDRPLINPNVRGIFELGTEDYISDFPYRPKPYGDLNQTTDNINATKCVIVFAESLDDLEQDDIRDTVQLAATQYQQHPPSRTAINTGVKFFWSFAPTRLSSTVRDALRLGPPTHDAGPVVVLLDVPDGGSFYVMESSLCTLQQRECCAVDLSADALLRFVASPGTRRNI